MHFTFTEIGCPAIGPGDLKFITDSLLLFGLIDFSNSEIRSVNDARRCHATDNERIHKESQFYTPEKHHRLCLKIYNVCPERVANPINKRVRSTSLSDLQLSQEICFFSCNR